MGSETKKESWYNSHAKKGCSECGGKGMIRYYFRQDDVETAPCVRCFPDDLWAKSVDADWDRDQRMLRMYESW